MSNKTIKIKKSDKDGWDKLKIISSAIGSILIPIVIALMGWLINSSLANEHQEIAKEIAEGQLVKDYINIINTAVNDDNIERLNILIDLFVIFKNNQKIIPPIILSNIDQIKNKIKNKINKDSILQSTNIYLLKQYNAILKKLDNIFDYGMKN